MIDLITRSMLVRSLLTSVVVGALLFVINQGPRLLQPWDLDLTVRLAATGLVPFLVSLVSAVLTRRELMRSTRDSDR